jgi:O-methyltransferase
MSKKLEELTAFFNKQYRDQRDGQFLQGLQTAFLHKLKEYYGGRLPDHIFFADDCFVVYRNLGFLSDEFFINSVLEANPDPVLLGRIWRLWILAWSMSSRWLVPGGIFVDCGTYNGQAFEIAIRYSKKRFGHIDHQLFAFDIFDQPPDEARKVDHGPELYSRVSERLGRVGNCVTVQGMLPGVIEWPGEKTEISWCQIDLNSAEADISTFEKLLPMLMPGAMVIFDDYGFSRYSSTQTGIDALTQSYGSAVLELPTGQGLYIHRP